MNRTKFSKIGVFLILFMITSSCQADNTKQQTAIEEETANEIRDAQLAADGGVSDVMKQQAVLFRSTLRRSQGYRSGVYVYNSRSITDYANNPKKLAARLALLGFDDVYLSASKNAVAMTDATAFKWIKDFNRHAHSYGLTVWALRFADTNAYVNDAMVTDECNRIKAYNLAVAENERFDAANADWEPHMLKQGGADTPAGLTYFWDSTNNYGKGGSNDLLLKRTLDILQLAKNNLGEFPLSEAISYMFQPRFDSALLNWGSATQFVGICDYAIAMCYYYKKETVWARAETLLTNANTKSKSVSICIKTSVDTYGDGGDPQTSMQPAGWDALLVSLNYLYTQGATKSAFRGVDFFEYQGIEIMWNTVATKSSVVEQRPAISVDKGSNRILISDIGHSSQLKYRIFNGGGKEIMRHNLLSNQIDISGLSKGVYFVKINNQTTKIVL